MSPLRVTVKGRSDVGMVRDENEDSLVIHEPMDPAVAAEKGVLVVLADGMGGLDAGSTASRIAVETVLASYYARKEAVRDALEGAVKDANRAIFSHANTGDTTRVMGSTVTALALVGTTACIAHVGDSRAFCYRQGILRQITRDHSLVRELVDMGKLAESSPTYAYHRNYLTRGLGLREDVAVDVFEVPDMEAGDEIVVTSDGLHEIVKPPEMAGVLQQFASDLDAACGELVRMARERGGPDNITVAVAALSAGEGSDPAAAAAANQDRRGARKRRAVPAWLFPFALFACFASGVVLTLLIEQPPPLSGTDLLQLRSELEGMERELALPPGPAVDPDREARLKAHLESIRKLLRKR